MRANAVRIERRLGSGPPAELRRLHETLDDVARLLQCGARPPQRREKLERRLDAANELGGDELCRLRRRTGLPLPGPSLSLERTSAEKRLDDPHARDAIGHAVMDLGDQREPVVLEAVDDPHLPGWLVDVERKLQQIPTDSF